ncbi:MAG: deacetylase [Sedimentisphaerales bacterium]|jgi:hypothetical protein
MKLLITIDTESDNAWSRYGGITTENAKYLPRFQQLCERYDFKPTYLVSHEMALDDFFVEFARDTIKRNACEIGLHPHAWTTPPIVPLTSEDMVYKPYLMEFSERIIREKVKVLTELLGEKFAVKMCSHRAGRWGFNEAYARILCEFDYKVDCSVTPLQLWAKDRRPKGEPESPVLDYRDFPLDAYFLNADDISKPGDLPILELPMTIIPNYGKLFSKLYFTLPRGIQQTMRVVFGRPVSWFRPHRVYRELLQVAKHKLDEESDYIMFMLHSSELMAAGSPTFRNQKEIEFLYKDIEEAFDFLRTNGVIGVTCQEYYKAFLNKEKMQGI